MAFLLGTFFVAAGLVVVKLRHPLARASARSYRAVGVRASDRYELAAAWIFAAFGVLFICAGLLAVIGVGILGVIGD